MLFSGTKILEPLYASYHHQNGRHHKKTMACSTMSYNSSAKKTIHHNSKRLTYKYSKMLIDTYPGILGWIDYREECWKHQRVVELVEYYAAPFDYLRTRYCFWSKPGGIFYALISEGRMLPTPQGLNPMTHKGKRYMVANNSFFLQCCNSVKEACYLATTRSST